MGIRRFTRLRCVLVALYGLAMALLPFAHQPAISGTNSPGAAELAAYALPDGTLPLLCKTDGTGPDSSVARAGCPACTLLSSPGLLPPDQVLAPASLPHATLAVPCTPERMVASSFNISARPRAPPAA